MKILESIIILFGATLAQNGTCPVCFDCSKSSCLNSGVCDNGSCQCEDGFGSENCQFPGNFIE